MTFDLQRFVTAQDAGGVYLQALTELQEGRKRSHWMWFVFPQIAGLGRSPTAQRYAIVSVAEAEAYLAHHRLGPRLLACSEILARHHTGSAQDILGPIDALKLRSSMTLFHRAGPAIPVFAQVLGRYFNGQLDPATEQILDA